MALIPIANKLSDWIEISKQRKDLRELTDHQLKDIGVSRKEAMREAGRSFLNPRILEQSSTIIKTASASGTKLPDESPHPIPLSCGK